MNWLTKLFCKHRITHAASEREMAWHLPMYCRQSQQVDFDGIICNKCNKLLTYRTKPKNFGAYLEFDPMKILLSFRTDKEEKESFNWYHC